MQQFFFNPQPDEAPTQGPIFEEDGGMLAGTVSAIANSWRFAGELMWAVALVINVQTPIWTEELPRQAPLPYVDDDIRPVVWTPRYDPRPVFDEDQLVPPIAVFDDDTTPAPAPWLDAAFSRASFRTGSFDDEVWVQPSFTPDDDPAGRLAVWATIQPQPSSPDDSDLPVVAAPPFVGDSDDTGPPAVWPAALGRAAADDEQLVPAIPVFDDDTQPAPRPWVALTVVPLAGDDDLPAQPVYDDDTRPAPAPWPSILLGTVQPDEQLVPPIAVFEDDTPSAPYPWPARLIFTEAQDDPTFTTTPAFEDDTPVAPRPWPAILLITHQQEQELPAPVTFTESDDLAAVIRWPERIIPTVADDEQLVPQPAPTMVDDDSSSQAVVWVTAPLWRQSPDDEQLAVAPPSPDDEQRVQVWAWGYGRAPVVDDEQLAAHGVPEDETPAALIVPWVRFTYLPPAEDSVWTPLHFTQPIYPLGSTVIFLGQYSRVLPQTGSAVVAQTRSNVVQNGTKSTVVKNWEG